MASQDQMDPLLKSFTMRWQIEEWMDNQPIEEILSEASANNLISARKKADEDCDRQGKIVQVKMQTGIEYQFEKDWLVEMKYQRAILDMWSQEWMQRWLHH
jgi:hypothetical protein